MSDNDDWFERALREDEAGDDAEGEVDADRESGAGDDAEEATGPTEEPAAGEDDGPRAGDISDDADDWAAEWGEDDDTSEASGDDSDSDADDWAAEWAADDAAVGRSGGGDGDSNAVDGDFGGDDVDSDESGDDINRDESGDDINRDESGDDINRDADDSSTDDDNAVDDSDADTDDDSGSPFDQDFASALENAPGPDSGFGSGQSQSDDGGDSPFGGGGDGDSPFGGGGGGDSPFGEGQEGGGPPFGGGDDDEFGFGDFGGDEQASFDEEEEFESDLERLEIGIEGLDQMILGGVPRRSLMVAIGSAGTGKTTFGLQFLNHGLKQGENAVYITLEESFERIVSTADEKGWGFREYVENDRLSIVDIDPIEMANSLDSIQNDLPNLIEDFGADRLVLDSVSLLEMMYESAPRRRSQVFGFARALKNAGITILLTSEADRDHAYASRFGIVEYLADAVFVLQYVRPNDFQETRLAIEIQKIRDANHSRETKPYDLTAEGIDVYRQANIF